jgi:hypothetical protein
VTSNKVPTRRSSPAQIARTERDRVSVVAKTCQGVGLSRVAQPTRALGDVGVRLQALGVVFQARPRLARR